MSTRMECAVCRRELPEGHGGPCPDCGSARRRQMASLGGAIERDTALPANVGKVASARLATERDVAFPVQWWPRVHEYYDRHPVFFPAAICLAVGSPFVGLFLAGVPGVLLGLALSAVCFLAGLRGVTKVRDIERRT